jgi:hypothetical protein
MKPAQPFSKAVIMVEVARRESITTTAFPSNSFFSNSKGVKAKSIFIKKACSLQRSAFSKKNFLFFR